MTVEWIVQRADPIGVTMRRIHLARYSGAQPEQLFLNVMPETVRETLNEGDVCGVNLTLIRRRGLNGQ